MDPSPVRWLLLVGIAVVSPGCSGTPYDMRDHSYSDVDIIRDCQDKPYFDKVSATDRRTIIKGMTEHEREVCGSRSTSGSSSSGSGM